MNIVKLEVSKVLVFNEDIELFPSGNYYTISPGNNYPTKCIMLVLVGVPIRNKLGWVEVSKGD